MWWLRAIYAYVKVRTPSNMWVPGTELRASSLRADTFTCCLSHCSIAVKRHHDLGNS